VFVQTARAHQSSYFTFLSFKLMSRGLKRIMLGTKGVPISFLSAIQRNWSFPDQVWKHLWNTRKGLSPRRLSEMNAFSSDLSVNSNSICSFGLGGLSGNLGWCVGRNPPRVVMSPQFPLFFYSLIVLKWSSAH
jgi:hypothetical protein